MGASHSRTTPKKPSDKQEGSKNTGVSPRDLNGGYFIFSFKDSKMKIVNISSSQQKIINIIIKRHCRVTKEGWEHGRSMTYFFKVERIDKYELIRLTTDLLLSLYAEGWEPMTPIDTAIDKAEKQTSICWKKREETGGLSNFRGSAVSLASVTTKGSGSGGVSECLCIETFSNNCLGFHNTPNTLLHDIVTELQEQHLLEAVSSGVSSVISDYTSNMPPVLNISSMGQLRKVVRLVGEPWSNLETSERLTIKIIGVLANSGYTLSMPINIDTDTRVYFFIRDPDEHSECVKVPTMTKTGQYQPMVMKSKASLYGRTNSVRSRLRASLRRKTLVRKLNSDGPSTAWWQQTSIDMGDADQSKQ